MSGRDVAHAVDEVVLAAEAVFLDHEAVHVGVEAGESLVELAHELQVREDLAVEALARDQQRDARRYGVSSEVVMRPSSASMATRSVSRCAMRA